MYQITYEGPLVSNNKFYAGMHWTTRNKIKDDYRLIFNNLLKKAKVPKFEQFRIESTFNSRHDADNLVATLKIFVDCLKGTYTPEDNTKYFKGFSIDYDESLKKNTIIFKICPLLSTN